ncbi:condensation domain-containing protein, partial [Clostridium beijerinckii]
MIDDKVMESYFNDYENRKISTKELLKKLNNIGLSRKTKSLLSEGQKGLWAIQNMDKENTSYNIPICFRFQKKENLNLFRKAVEFIWKQYPILKSTIIEESGKLYQVIDTAMLLSYEVMQIENKDDFEMAAYIKEIANQPFTLNEGPLFRVQVLESPNNQTVLVNIHHIICDGTSSVILTKALLHAYQQLVEQKEPKLVDRKDSYSDFVDWETTMLSGRRGKEHSEFWKQQLQGELTATELMPDLSESKQSGAIGDMFQLSLSSEIKKKIKAFANAQRISLPSFFLSVLNIFLYQCTNQSDITVGVASMGRPEERFESLLGYFINMIPIRSQIKESDKFQDYARDLQNKMLDCLDHADYPCTYI